MFLNVCKQTCNISHACISQSVKGFNVKSSTYYFHVTTKILADFQICISVPLIFTYHYLQQRIRFLIFTGDLDHKLHHLNSLRSINTEAAIQNCSYEKVFWKNAANLQENTHTKVWFQNKALQHYWNRPTAWVFSF